MVEIDTESLNHLLVHFPQVVCMIQKEVAERIAEKLGTKTYGILSVLLQAWYDIEYLFTVGEGAFDPPPKAKSAVLYIMLHFPVPSPLSWTVHSTAYHLFLNFINIIIKDENRYITAFPQWDEP